MAGPWCGGLRRQTKDRTQRVQARRLADRTAFFLVADHGMEESNPECTGNWADALDATGLAYRDEGYGFIYVNP